MSPEMSQRSESNPACRDEPAPFCQQLRETLPPNPLDGGGRQREPVGPGRRDPAHEVAVNHQDTRLLELVKVLVNRLLAHGK